MPSQYYWGENRMKTRILKPLSNLSVIKKKNYILMQGVSSPDLTMHPWNTRAQ